MTLSNTMGLLTQLSQLAEFVTEVFGGALIQRCGGCDSVIIVRAIGIKTAQNARTGGFSVGYSNKALIFSQIFEYLLLEY